VLEKIRRLFEYESWAITRELVAFSGLDNQNALAMLAHILAAKEIWLARLNGQDSSSVATHPNLSCSECETLARTLDARYNEFLSSLVEADLTSSITYKNTKGEEFTTPIGDVLTHIAFHSAYHRGQIALLLRQAENAAVNTDFITFARL